MLVRIFLTFSLSIERRDISNHTQSIHISRFMTDWCVFYFRMSIFREMSLQVPQDHAVWPSY